MKNKKNKKKYGFTLVETLVAISIFTMSLVGMMSILASSISNTNYAKQEMTASYLAQEGIEYIRNMRDVAVLKGEWTDSFTEKLRRCRDDRECGFDKSQLPSFDVEKCSSFNNCELLVYNGDYNTNTGAPSGFTRKIWREEIDASKQIKIYSKVEWTQGSGGHSITFSENLFNWY